MHHMAAASSGRRRCTYCAAMSLHVVTGEQVSMFRHLFRKSVPLDLLNLTSRNISAWLIGDAATTVNARRRSVLLTPSGNSCWKHPACEEHNHSRTHWLWLRSPSDWLLDYPASRFICSLNDVVRTACRMLQSNRNIRNILWMDSAHYILRSSLLH